MSSDIEQFLRERLDHDEREIRRRWNRHGVTSEKFHGTPLDPVRVLADVEAKRRILEHHARLHHYAEEQRQQEYVLAAGAGDVVLKLLALPYADHPDYRKEWRP